MADRQDHDHAGGRSHLSIDLPATPEVLALARMAASLVGTRAQLSLEEVDDLRLAVDELCVLMFTMGSGAEDRLQLRYEWDGSAIDVTCQLVCESPPDRSRAVLDAPDSAELSGLVPSELSRQILTALVDSLELHLELSTPTGRFRKGRSAANA